MILILVIVPTSLEQWCTITQPSSGLLRHSCTESVGNFGGSPAITITVGDIPVCRGRDWLLKFRMEMQRKLRLLVRIIRNVNINLCSASTIVLNAYKVYRSMHPNWCCQHFLFCWELITNNWISSSFFSTGNIAQLLLLKFRFKK
jgi:hypothetical protein